MTSFHMVKFVMYTFSSLAGTVHSVVINGNVRVFVHFLLSIALVDDACCIHIKGGVLMSAPPPHKSLMLTYYPYYMCVSTYMYI